MPKHSKLPVEERVEAVLALLRKEEPAAVLARRFVEQYGRNVNILAPR